MTADQLDPIRERIATERDAARLAAECLRANSICVASERKRLRDIVLRDLDAAMPPAASVDVEEMCVDIMHMVGLARALEPCDGEDAANLLLDAFGHLTALLYRQWDRAPTLERCYA